MSIMLPGSGVPPAVIIALTSASCSAGNIWFGGLPPASRRSKRSPMRSISALGKREKTRTFSGIATYLKRKGRNRFAISPFAAFHSSPELGKQGARVDLDARPHGRGDRDALDIGSLRARGLCLGDCVGQRLHVRDQLVLGE